jgi:hypothetical protein
MPKNGRADGDRLSGSLTGAAHPALALSSLHGIFAALAPKAEVAPVALS